MLYDDGLMYACNMIHVHVNICMLVSSDIYACSESCWNQSLFSCLPIYWYCVRIKPVGSGLTSIKKPDDLKPISYLPLSVSSFPPFFSFSSYFFRRIFAISVIGAFSIAVIFFAIVIALPDLRSVSVSLFDFEFDYY